MVSQMYGWMCDGIDVWMDSVCLRYSVCGKLDVCMDGWIVLVWKQKGRMDGWMD